MATITIVQAGLGVFGFMHEVLVTAGERPVLLGACLALVGGSVLLGALELWRQP